MFIKNIADNIKPVNVFIFIIVNTLAVLTFVGYAWLAGIPMTQARNLFNAALLEKSVTKRKLLLEESIAIWKTAEAEDALLAVNQLTVN